MTFIEKQEIIRGINKQQISCIENCKIIASLPFSADISEIVDRASMVIKYALLARDLEIQKHIIISQPTLDGHISGGSAILGENGRELAFDKDGQIFSIAKPTINTLK